MRKMCIPILFFLLSTPLFAEDMSDLTALSSIKISSDISSVRSSFEKFLADHPSCEEHLSKGSDGITTYSIIQEMENSDDYHAIFYFEDKKLYKWEVTICRPDTTSDSNVKMLRDAFIKTKSKMIKKLSAPIIDEVKDDGRKTCGWLGVVDPDIFYFTFLISNPAEGVKILCEERSHAIKN